MGYTKVFLDSWVSWPIGYYFLRWTYFLDDHPLRSSSMIFLDDLPRQYSSTIFLHKLPRWSYFLDKLSRRTTSKHLFDKLTIDGHTIGLHSISVHTKGFDHFLTWLNLFILRCNHGAIGIVTYAGHPSITSTCPSMVSLSKKCLDVVGLESLSRN